MSEAEIRQRGMESGPGVMYANLQLEDYGVDPKEILIQIIKRPSDPLTEKLQTCVSQWISAGFAVQNIKDQFMGWIDVTRNWQAHLFRNAPPQFKYAMLIDADVGPVNAATPVLLARHRAPVVSACVPSFTKEKGLFLCLVVRDKDGTARWVSFNETKKIPGSGLCELHNCGTGCVMIRRDVFDKLWENFENEREAEAIAKDALMSVVAQEALTDKHRASIRGLLRKLNYVEDISGAPFSIPQSVRDLAAKSGIIAKGEDICFSDRVRAAGFSLYVDFEVHCYHEKMMALMWPQDAIDHELSVEDWKMSAFAPALAKV